MPEGCEGGGEAQGGGYGGSASCGSAPRCRTLFQARLRGCKFCMQRGGGLHVPGANTKCCRETRRFRRRFGPIARQILTPKFPRSTQDGIPDAEGAGGVQLKARTWT